MTARIIDGRAIAREMRREVAEQVEEFKMRYGRPPGLAVILVGDYAPSLYYVRTKARYCEDVGMYSEVHHLPAHTPEDEVLKLVDRLNHDGNIHGFLVQLPLPDHINPLRVQWAIDPEKDVDGLHPINVGRLVLGEDCLVPATPAGIMEALRREHIEVEGKRAVIVGRSNIVGKPMAMLLMHANATPTICHSRTRPLGDVTREGDILVAAVGVPELIKADMVKPGAVVIDVGVNRVEDPATEKGYRVVGDVAFDEVKEVASAITPVPGGVGPLTIAHLLVNNLIAARRQVEKEARSA
ncbi:MAG: bifunctional methylenetetrahydrofolate dehydrogenase/methenyltetrahydrofolate cyclohydrolase FolD [Chloroflexi bacterium]|nr:MAG: bifunctional methylenetetrahydrofolate dehydrogenase/methenyltetrahydrofolate cyclohydrolase FolD [Chloroflexota bacterium]